jgi:methanogenic corrinoid protein MtbC1
MAGLNKGGGNPPRSAKDGDWSLAPSSQSPFSPDRGNAAMNNLVASEIIPRLSEVSRHPNGPHLSPMSDLGREEVETFAEMAGFGRSEDIDYFVANLLQREGRDEAVLDLLAATARRLGQLWVEDEVDFATVTIGVCRLQTVLHRLSDAHAQLNPPQAGFGSVLLASCPGDQHDFGVLLVAEFMRRAGIEVSLKPSALPADIVRAVAMDSFQIAGLSLSREAMIPQLESLIVSIRQKSRNPGIKIMVGGRVFLDQPELAKAVGADFRAVDGRDAVFQTQKIMPQLTRIETVR